MSRKYFIQLRVYRKKDHHYWTLHLEMDAESLSSLEATVHAYEAGLKVAGAELVSLERIFFDYPQGDTPAEHYKTIADIETHVIMHRFLQMRDRRIKEESYTTEDNPNGTDIPTT